MKMEKRRRVFVLIGVLLIAAIALAATICFRYPIKEKEETKQQDTKMPGIETEETDETIGETNVTPGETVFENFSVLESRLTSEQIKMVQEQLTDFLKKEDESYSLVVCQEILLEVEDGLEFYCEFPDVPGTVLHCVFDFQTGMLQIVKEKIDIDVLNQTPGKTKELVEDNQQDELPKAWEYVEEDNTEVELTGKEMLDKIVPAENLKSLEKELLAFLKANEEYRRKLFIESDSQNPLVSETEEGTEFWIAFSQERLDKKEIRCVCDSENVWHFFLEQKETEDK